MISKALMEKLTTRRLLALYKAERKRSFNAGYDTEFSEHVCDCYPSDPRSAFLKTKYEEQEKYLQQIKMLLGRREHIFLRKAKQRASYY